MYLNTNYF